MKKDIQAYYELGMSGVHGWADSIGKQYCMTSVVFYLTKHDPYFCQAIMKILDARRILLCEEHQYWKGEPHHVIFRNHVDDEIHVEVTQSEIDISIFSRKPGILKRYSSRFKKIATMVDSNNDYHIWVPVTAYLTEQDKMSNQGIAIPTKYEEAVPLGNYPASTRDEIKSLESILNEKEYFGRIIILHGPPGTGKSFYIRRLISKLHQEKKVNSIYFFMGLGIRRMELEHCLYNNLLISEDADAILGSRQDDNYYNEFTSKILNFSSGFVQTKGLFVFTSNLDAMDISPAFMRDGRLLAYIKFGAFSRKEGEEWLRIQGCQADLSMDSQEYTLANLYAVLNNFKKIESAQKPETMIGFRAR